VNMAGITISETAANIIIYNILTASGFISDVDISI
jgi:hypothetical protein